MEVIFLFTLGVSHTWDIWADGNSLGKWDMSSWNILQIGMVSPKIYFGKHLGKWHQYCTNQWYLCLSAIEKRYKRVYSTVFQLQKYFNKKILSQLLSYKYTHTQTSYASEASWKIFDDDGSLLTSGWYFLAIYK